MSLYLDKLDNQMGNLINSGFKTFTKKKGQASFPKCEAFFILFFAHPLRSTPLGLTLLLIGGQFFLILQLICRNWTQLYKVVYLRQRTSGYE